MAEIVDTLSVLIETLWNVKFENAHSFLQEIPVLIETLWNVKKRASSASLRAATGFNRNIVEGKGLIFFIFLVLFSCFNRNIVECKVFYNCEAANVYTVLIETLWNVKMIMKYMGLEKWPF